MNFGSRVASRFGARGLTRGGAMVLSGVNVAACGITYGLGEKKEEKTL